MEVKSKLQDWFQGSSVPESLTSELTSLADANSAEATSSDEEESESDEAWSDSDENDEEVCFFNQTKLIASWGILHQMQTFKHQN